jgi:transposase
LLAAGLHQGRAEWRQLDARIAAFDAEFARMAREVAAARRLATIPGIGLIPGARPKAARRLRIRNDSA